MDRALHNGIWFDMFDFTHVVYQANGLSDHTPIMLDFPACPRPKKNFMFCEMWIKDAHFKEIVKSHMDRRGQASALKVLQQLLHSLKKPNRELNKYKFADIYAQQIKARTELLQIQTQLQADPYNKDLLIQEDIKRHHYVNITHSALALMKQQSNAEWIGFGDECSRHFMAKIKQRKALQSIYQIKDSNDQWVEGFDRVADIMTDFYHNLLGEQEQHISTIEKEIIHLGHTLSPEQQLKLCQPFTDNDIKQALFSIPNHKSPGPDGFNNGFYNACWDII